MSPAWLPGRILLSVHTGNFSPVDREEIEEKQPKWWNIRNFAIITWKGRGRFGKLEGG